MSHDLVTPHDEEVILLCGHEHLMVTGHSVKLVAIGTLSVKTFSFSVETILVCHVQLIFNLIWCLFVIILLKSDDNSPC